ncbi:MAG: permease prefix domain 1-containing protein [Sphaerochaetaceae bacterium]
MFDLETQVRKWKNHLFSAGAIGYSDVEELESHLRDSIDELMERGVSAEEAFLLAVRRMGDVAVIQEEFAKISTEDLWRQLLVPADNPLIARRNRTELEMVIVLALFAGLLAKIPALFGYGNIEAHSMVYVENASLFAFIPVALYFIWKRSLPVMRSLLVMGIFLLSALVVNLYPSYTPHHTGFLTALHLPIALLFLLMYFYGGPSLGKESMSNPERPLERKATGWRSTNTRLNFIRFVGEAFIYAVLIGLGGLVLIFLTMGTFDLLGVDASQFIASWMAPFGFFGLFIVASYLVGQKKNLIESIAPVLAKIFTPLFLLVLLGLIVAFLLNPLSAFENRNMLIWFDLILAFILGLTLYSMSAKDVADGFSADHTSTIRHTVWDVFSLALIIAAVIIDAIALYGIAMRLGAYGFSPNKTAALGENIILLVNLILLMVGYFRYLRGIGTFQAIVVMQMRFLVVYAAWAAFVVVVFPLVFGFR